MNVSDVEAAMYEALLYDVRHVDVDNDAKCEELTDCIVIEHTLKRITNEQQRYLFDLLIARN